MIETIIYGSGLAVLGLTAWQDWKNESFNPSSLLLYFALASINISPGLIENLGGITICGLSLAAIRKNYIRLGDALPLAAYAATFPSLQSFFTLLTVTGLYLSIFKHRTKEKEWIPYIPAVLLAYIIQLTTILL